MMVAPGLAEYRSLQTAPCLQLATFDPLLPATHLMDDAFRFGAGPARSPMTLVPTTSAAAAGGGSKVPLATATAVLAMAASLPPFAARADGGTAAVVASGGRRGAESTVAQFVKTSEI
mmetsp:Transcript_70012/g.181592  ORF Transcript_70012/g.181592 Transcript_70012/m.181592 type:complete len:118 (+) Transcript_70012:20-373(+)